MQQLALTWTSWVRSVTLAPRLQDTRVPIRWRVCESMVVSSSSSTLHSWLYIERDETELVIQWPQVWTPELFYNTPIPPYNLWENCLSLVTSNGFQREPANSLLVCSAISCTILVSARNTTSSWPSLVSNRGRTESVQEWNWVGTPRHISNNSCPTPSVN